MLPDAAFADNILEKTIRRGEEESEKTDMKTARIIDVCISEKKGVQKVPAERIEMRPDWGIEGDAHAGNWHRQVSLLAQESVDHLQRLLTKIRLKPGDFGENIVTGGNRPIRASRRDPDENRHCAGGSDADRKRVSSGLCDPSGGG